MIKIITDKDKYKEKDNKTCISKYRQHHPHFVHYYHQCVQQYRPLPYLFI